MNGQVRVAVAAAASVAVALAVGRLYQVPAQDKAPPAREAAKEESPDVVAVRKTAEEFVRAFDKGDAKAVAALWTPDGEYVGPDGETVRGRAALEKDYADFFKKNPGARVEVKVESVRLLGRHTALEEGALKLWLPGVKEPGQSRYSVLHVREDDGWRMASVREWVPDPAELIALKDVEWLVGDWVAKSADAEVRAHYGWDEDKAYLHGRYTVKRDGKVASSGTQIIGKDPAGGLRSWVFDSSGGFGESSWSRDGDRWVMEASGTLPDGSPVTATNVLIPLGHDAFTWQSVERSAAGAALPDTPPVKVTRAKAEK